jgi:hypothetical protein
MKGTKMQVCRQGVLTGSLFFLLWSLLFTVPTAYSQGSSPGTGGVGAYLEITTDGAWLTPAPDGPLKASGVSDKEQLKAVDGKSIIGLS